MTTKPPRDQDATSDTLVIFGAIIGAEATMRLALRFGGCKLYIPNDPPLAGELVEAIGEQAALQLAQRFGGSYVEMPLERAKRERIIAYSTHPTPLPAREIARIVGCTERHVYQVRREFRDNGGVLPSSSPEPADPRQLSIFGPADPTPTED